METGKSHTVKRFSGLEVYCLLNQMTQIDKDCDACNEYIRIYGPELGRYCFSSNSDVGFVENVAESIQGKKECAIFRMLQIEEGKHVYHIYTFVTLMNRGDIGMYM